MLLPFLKSWGRILAIALFFLSFYLFINIYIKPLPLVDFKQDLSLAQYWLQIPRSPALASSILGLWLVPPCSGKARLPADARIHPAIAQLLKTTCLELECEPQAEMRG